ncbi:MAG: plasmid mobilization protein [Caldisericaceae bacterium]
MKISKKDTIRTFKVSEEDLRIIDEYFKRSGYKNFSEYARHCLKNAKIIKVDTVVLLKACQEIDELLSALEKKGCDPETLHGVRNLSHKLAVFFERVSMAIER